MMTVEELLYRLNNGQIITFYPINVDRRDFVIEIRNCSGDVEETRIRHDVPMELVKDLDDATYKLEGVLNNLIISDQQHNQKYN